MDKNNKHKFVFKLAQEFLDKIIAEQPGLNNSVLRKHLQHESKFENIKDAAGRLFLSLTNRDRMFSVIGFKLKEDQIKKILFDYNPNKILSFYKDPNALLQVFRKRFNLQNAMGERSLWRKFTEGIISGSQFMTSFRDKKNFDDFIKNFAFNKYTKAALPMLLSKEIKGFGFALSCDFLKELGYRDYPKPDRHLIEIFYNLGLSETEEPCDVYKSIIEMAVVVKEDAYTVDKIFWLLSSGNFYLVNIQTGKCRDQFINDAKTKLNGVNL